MTLSRDKSKGLAQQQAKNNLASSSTATNQNTQNTPNWKVFKRDSEAGRLLGRLYGVQSNEPKIHYPKLKRRISGKGKDDKEDLSQRTPWNQTKKDEKQIKKAIVKVPKVGQPKTAHKSSLVSTIPRRKTEESCQEELKRNFLLRSHYRPPMNNTSMTNEKDRLCELHEYGGGCALPDELTHPKQVLPSQAKKVENTDAGQIRVDEQNWSLADQLVTEIRERQEFQLEMEENGLGDATREKIVTEISKRMEQLMKIDSEKARKIAKR